MSARKFIAELERRRFLSDRLLGKLRESMAAAKAPLSAEKVAAFLVQKNHITQGQANELLAGLSRSGVNLAEEDRDPEQSEGSSIFGPAVVPRKPQTSPSGFEPDDDADEIRLVPIDEGFAPPRSGRPVPGDDAAPVLGILSPTDEADARSSSRGRNQPSADLIEIGDPDGADGRSRDEISFEPSPAEYTNVAKVVPARRTTRLNRDKGSKKRKKPVKGKKSWDSPMILIGGGGLMFLILAGGAIWFLLNWESGDQKLALAREALKSGAYPKAAEHYKDFIDTSPRHPEHSLARVELAMLRIRQPTEAGDFAQALAATESETKSVEDEPAFGDAHAELAALIPQIAQGLAKQAEAAPPTSEDSAKFVALTNKALELCDNASYVPKQLRDEAKLAAVRDSLELVERRHQSQVALEAALKEMDTAVAAGKPIGAYAIHTTLVREHPELSDEKALAEAVQKTTAAEKAAIRFVEEQQPAETSERPTPWIAALAVASHRGGTAPVQGPVCVRVDGAVYGLDSSTGRLLWRRFVGFGATGWPIPIGPDVLIADTTRQELLRVDAATGRLIWRQSLKSRFAEPLIVGDRAYIGTDGGRLYVVDLKSGAIRGHVQFPQPIRIAPTLDRLKKHIYVTGDRATLYTVSLPDMKCAGVFFAGHAPGAIAVSPVLVMDKLALAENNGAETSRLRLLSVNENYVLNGQQATRRLTGLVTTPPVATGRGLVLVTDRGQVEVYEVAPGNEGEVLTSVATRPAAGTQPITRHLGILGKNIWLADTQLTKYNIVPTNNRLPVEEIQNNFAGSTFDHPLITRGETLIEVHRPKDRPGAVVAAIDTTQGRALWETDIAVSPAGAPVVDEANKSITIGNSLGNAFRFDEAAIRSRVQDQPLAADGAPPKVPALSASAELGQGRAAFFTQNSDWLLLYNPAQSNTAKWVHLEGQLAGGITRFGAGFIAPTKIGQVFFLGAADGGRLAIPFQPRVEPGSSLDYKPAVTVPGDGRSFLITDSKNKVYAIAVVDQPQSHLEMSKQADVGPRPITSTMALVGNTALAVAGDSRVVRFQLPALESAGETSLPAPGEWGPYTAGDAAILATVDQKLLAVAPGGEVRWQVPLEHGQLAGEPLVLGDGVLLAYRKGVIERRSIADGKPLGTLNVEHPLATGPVSFLQKLVVTSADGTVFVLQQP
jgi:outer membrane protein assembly factor BamB